MLLRATTTFFLLLGLFLAFAFPWILGAKPHGHAELAHYSVKFGIYLIVLLGSFVAACVCALLLVRRVRNSYREQSRQNLEFLIESTLRTHHKEPPGDSSPSSEGHDEDET